MAGEAPAETPVTFDETDAEARARRAEALLDFLARTAPIAILQFNSRGECVVASNLWAEWTGVSGEPGVTDWLSPVHPEDRAALQRAAVAVLETGKDTRIELRIQSPDAKVSVVVAHIRRFDEAQVGRGALLFALDASELHQARELAARTRRITELARTADVIEPREGLVRLLQNVADRARELIDAPWAAISTFDENGVMDRFIYTGISDELAMRLGQPPTGRGLLGILARHDLPIRVANLQEHPSFTGWPEGHPDMGCFLGIPIRAGGRTIGSLYITRERGAPEFTPADEDAAVLLASQVALSLSAAISQERRGRVALLEERVRIAHDLHDGTIQSLYALGLEFDSARLLQGVPPELDALLDTAVGRINSVIADIRNYIQMLEATTPSAVPDLASDLPHVIREMVPPGIDTVVNITAPALQEISARAVEDFLFITREALSNAVRHGRPTKIAIDLRQSGGETALTIQDNGSGFDPATVKKGLGYTTMHTRAERLGARLTILGIPGMGGTVRVALPRPTEMPFEVD